MIKRRDVDRGIKTTENSTPVKESQDIVMQLSKDHYIKYIGKHCRKMDVVFEAFELVGLNFSWLEFA